MSSVTTSVGLEQLEPDSGQHDEIDQDQRWTGIAFEMMGQYFVVPLGEVAEVIYPPVCIPVPNTQQWFKGLANIRGRLLAVSDLAAFIGSTRFYESDHQKVLCISHHQHYIGLVVNQVFGVQHFNKACYFSDDDQLPLHLKQYCRGYFVQYQQQWNIFLFSQLLKNTDFMNASQY